MRNLTSMASALWFLRTARQQQVPEPGTSPRTPMKAAVFREYGPPEVLRIEEIEKPVPTDDDVLVRIVASTVCGADWRARKPDPAVLGWVMNGVSRPKRIKVLGMEFAGTVDALGRNVTRFKVGDRVFGSMGVGFGAYAEYACVPQDATLTRMPVNASFEEAAAIPYGGVTALYVLEKAGIKPGQRVLVYGASGCLGTAAVQLAKHFGAHVTAVCSGTNADLVKSIGADDVIDYTKDDFSTRGRVYDIIHDAVDKSGFWRSMRALRRGGVYVMVGPGLIPIVGGLWAKVTGSGTVIGPFGGGGIAALDFLRELVEQGRFRPVIDRCYPLSAIAEAHHYVDAGRKKGNVVINVAAAA